MIELAPGALLSSARIVTGGDIFKTQAVQEGRVFIQDEASQLVAALVGRARVCLTAAPLPEERPQRSPLAIPPQRSSPPSCTRIAPNCLRKPRAARERPGHSSRRAESPASKENFDRVLADVPCSGTGTLARNPEIKWG